MLIDPLGIFPQIKEAICARFTVVSVYAIGSRASGTSFTGKWDFDVAVITEERLSPYEVDAAISPLFQDKIDEFNKPVKIDFWTRSQDTFTENSLLTFKRYSNAVLL